MCRWFTQHWLIRSGPVEDQVDGKCVLGRRGRNGSVSYLSPCLNCVSLHDEDVDSSVEFACRLGSSQSPCVQSTLASQSRSSITVQGGLKLGIKSIEVGVAVWIGCSITSAGGSCGVGGEFCSCIGGVRGGSNVLSMILLITSRNLQQSSALLSVGRAQSRNAMNITRDCTIFDRERLMWVWAGGSAAVLEEAIEFARRSSTQRIPAAGIPKDTI